MRLHMTELLYIGHPILEEGVRPDVAKVAAIKRIDICRFLGMCNCLSRFIPVLSQASKPLKRLKESNTDFHWTSTEQEAFDEIKNLISQDQLLAFYDMNAPVVIQCDASGEGQLCCRGEDQLHQLTGREELCGTGAGVPCNSICVPQV